MASRSQTANTIDLDTLIKFYNPQTRVLAESLSIHDIPEDEDEDNPCAPPFPVSRPTSVLYACQLSGLTCDTNATLGNRRFTLAAPTPPRLRTMIQETFNIDRWAESLSALAAPGHTPWENKQVDSGPPPPSQPAPKPNCFSAYLRVQEDKEPVQSKDPCLNTTTELAEMMAELQSLNSFFKDGLEDTKHAMAILGKQKGRLEEKPAEDSRPEAQSSLPRLVVSNSHDAIQVPVGNRDIGNRKPLDAPLEIANRRGRKSLPPILVKKEKEFRTPHSTRDTLYPGIPTAFLGTPSARSASSTSFNLSPEIPLSTPPTPVPLQEMVNNLRSKCASIHQHVREKGQTESRIFAAMSGPPTTVEGACESEQPSTSDESRDSWTFADNFLQAVQCEVDEVFPLPTRLGPVLPSFPPPPTSLPPTPTKDSSPAIQPPPAPRKSLPPKTRAPPRSVPRRSTPAPPLPTTPLNKKPAQSILKSVKNVRFLTPEETPDVVSKPSNRKSAPATKSSVPHKSCLATPESNRKRLSLIPPATDTKVRDKQERKENVAPVRPRRYTISNGGFRGSMRSLARQYKSSCADGGKCESGIGSELKAKEKDANNKKQTPFRSIFTRFK